MLFYKKKQTFPHAHTDQTAQHVKDINRLLVPVCFGNCFAFFLIKKNFNAPLCRILTKSARDLARTITKKKRRNLRNTTMINQLLTQNLIVRMIHVPVKVL